MFSFFKKRKEKKEQQLEQQREKLLAPQVNKETQNQSAQTELTPVMDRQALLENADLTQTDHIFIEKKRDITSVDAPSLSAVAPLPIKQPEIEPPPQPEPEIAPEPEPTPELPPYREPEPEVEPIIEPQTAVAELASVIAQDSTTQEKPSKGSWLSRLRQGLSRTGQNLTTLFVGVNVDEDLFEELETALIMADAGVEATNSLLTALRAKVRKDKITDGAAVKVALREALTNHLKALEKPFPLQSAKPLVVMIAGVNGAGKTTSIGKLAHTFQQQGASVLLAAGDTFRAAAREQLVEWGNRNNVQVIAQEGGNPGAVAFNAVEAGKSRQSDVVMVDTAGRLPTQLHLMEELKKVKRAITKADNSGPHECLLVVDGNTGQNALGQIKAFDAAIGLTGLVVTKLDGTAKGGILAAVAAGSQGVRPIPVYWIGVGEGMHDLQPFVASEFAGALLGD